MKHLFLILLICFSIALQAQEQTYYITRVTGDTTYQANTVKDLEGGAQEIQVSEAFAKTTLQSILLNIEIDNRNRRAESLVAADLFGKTAQSIKKVMQDSFNINTRDLIDAQFLPQYVGDYKLTINSSQSVNAEIRTNGGFRINGAGDGSTRATSALSIEFNNVVAFGGGTVEVFVHGRTAKGKLILKGITPGGTKIKLIQK